MSPEEAKKEELTNEPTFGKYLIMLKIKQKLINIRTKMRQDGLFEPDLIYLFST